MQTGQLGAVFRWNSNWKYIKFFSSKIAPQGGPLVSIYLKFKSKKVLTFLESPRYLESIRFMVALLALLQVETVLM